MHGVCDRETRRICFPSFPDPDMINTANDGQCWEDACGHLGELLTRLHAPACGHAKACVGSLECWSATLQSEEEHDENNEKEEEE